ncbi:MAG: zinc ribbon domain-containing protein [Oscillospiraceae bacterium]|nr:zinc ribbon domain-containing protein [Oscillospiraceae bacterium]
MYCINCGVKLADTEKKCPLCGVTACHPYIKQEEEVPLFPGQRYPTPQLPPRTAQIIITTLFLLPIFITLLCDLQINGAVVWSGYVVGALGMAYAIFVLPYWFRRPHSVAFTALSFMAIGLYVFYINQASGGDWFLTFALPVVGYVGTVVTAVAALLHRLRRGRLYIFGGAFLALGAFMPLMEYLIVATFCRPRFVGWSLYPMTALLLLGAMLIFLALNQPARERMERKFFL